MVRKRVWLGILVVFLIAMGFVNVLAFTSADYTFTRTSSDKYGMLCTDAVKTTYDGTLDGFYGNFFGQFDTSSNGFSQITQTDQSKDLYVTLDNAATGDDDCTDEKLQSEDYVGGFGFGYLYTLDNLNTFEYRVGSHCTDTNEGWYTTGAVAFFDISDYKGVSGSASSKPFRDYLVTIPKSSIKFYAINGVRDTHKEDDAEYGSIYSYSHATETLGFDPGVYFVALGLSGSTANTISWSVDIGSVITITRFNGEQSSRKVAYSLGLNRLDATIGNPKYIITDHLLTSEELNSLFYKNNFNLVENTSWLCNAAGGQLFTDIYSGFEYNSSSNELQYGLDTDVDFNISHLCCGNNNNQKENYVFNYTLSNDDVNTTYVCKNNIWLPATTVRETCEELIDDAFEYDNVYIHSLNANIPYYDIGTHPGITDGCCGDDIPGDVGNISGNNKYMCYDTKKNPNAPLFNWTDAALDKYYIKTIYKNVSGTIKEVDAISNSKDWYYCDATDTHRLTGGVRVREGKTFATIAPSGQFSCADMLSILVGEDFSDSCQSSGPPYTHACCKWVLNAQDIFGIHYENNIRNCDQCYKSLDTIEVNLDEYPFPGSTLPSSLGTDSLVDKEWCVLDPAACLNGTLKYKPNLNCSQQPTLFSNNLCNNSTHYCVNGAYLSTLDSTFGNECCFGADAKCVVQTDIDTDKKCSDVGGKPYVPSDAYYCSFDIYYGNPIKHCCLGTLSFNYAFTSNLAVKNTSFLCFKEDNNDIFSQCCYDSNCRNSFYAGGAGDLYEFNRRVLTKGSSIHTIQNYDQIDTVSIQNSLIRDKAGRFIINSGNNFGPKPVPIDSAWSLNPASFSYLEFDILTDSESMSLKLSQKDLGKVSDYMIGYNNNSGIWHHVIIPLNSPKLIGMTNLTTSLLFYDTLNTYEHIVVLDNILLSVPSTTANTTKNYYCTGGFSSWIDDLDSKSFPNTVALTFDQYGPHMFACNGLATFGWTGTQCCGDDTKLVNYGEFFNDTDAGCFNGSKIENNERLSDVLGVDEFANLDKDRLQYFEYADLLYFNDSFIGCQVIAEKYSQFKTSYSGDTNANPLIVDLTKQVKDQCAVVGDYYCMNKVWRKKILTNDNTNPGQEFPDTNIKLKMAPAGPELIRNGFREGCSPTTEVCGNNLDDDCDFQADESDCLPLYQVGS